MSNIFRFPFFFLKKKKSNKKSNIALQNAILKYGLDKFNLGVFEDLTYDNKLVSHNALIDLETSYIEKYSFDSLYYFKGTATSLAVVFFLLLFIIIKKTL